MKTRILILLFAYMTIPLFAQDIGCIPFHYMGYEYFQMENMMQQRNGDILTNIYIAESDDPCTLPVSLGYMVYKLSPSTLQFTDSLLLSDSTPPYYLYAQDPHGEGNIRVNFEYDEDRDSTFLRISHFTDEDLQIDHGEDLAVPLCEGSVLGYTDSYFVDCKGDLIMKYYKELPEGDFEGHIVRFGADGTLKHEAMLSQDQIFLRKMAVFSESPLKYYHWKGGPTSNLICYILDSTFVTEQTSIFNRMLNEESIPGSGYYVANEYFQFYSDTRVIPDGEDVLIAAQYTQDTSFSPTMAEHGVAVARFDIRTMERKNLIKFNELPGWSAEASCNGFLKMSDGALYLLYTEKDPYNPKKPTYVVKMDPDFNVEWKRYCKSLETVDLTTNYYCIPAVDAEGNEVMAIAGMSHNLVDDRLGGFYFFLHHDGTVGINEGGIEVRPYAFYPNPVRSQLRLQFSPDVQPAQVQLYDLQGRLVRNQYQAFEHIDMGSLSAGTYLMRITLTDGQVFSEKVVKE